MNTNSPNDQRYLPRWVTRNRVSYHLTEKPHPAQAQTKDISCAGTCIEAPKGLQRGQQVELAIELSNKVLVEVTGHIIWIKPGEKNDEVGIQFYNVSDSTQHTILEHAFEITGDPRKIWFKEWE